MYNSSWEHKSLSSHPILWQPPVVQENEKLQLLNPQTKMTRLPSIGQILAGIPGLSAPVQSYLPIYRDEYTLNQVESRTHLLLSQIHSQPTAPLPPMNEMNGLQRHVPVEGKRNLQKAEYCTYGAPNAQVASPPCSPPSRVHKKRGRKKKANATCKQCLLTQTPEWRCGPAGSRTLCNACGLYFLKLKKRFGFKEAGQIFGYKKRHNQVHIRVVPSSQEKQLFCNS